MTDADEELDDRCGIAERLGRGIPRVTGLLTAVQQQRGSTGMAMGIGNQLDIVDRRGARSPVHR